MGYYETMQVCLKGHKVTEHYNSSIEFRQEFCDKCGAKTIHKCLKCGTPIRGHYITEGVLDLTSTPVPYNCRKCGAAYPWAFRLKIFSFFKLLVSPIKFIIETIAKMFK